MLCGRATVCSYETQANVNRKTSAALSDNVTNGYPAGKHGRFPSVYCKWNTANELTADYNKLASQFISLRLVMCAPPPHWTNCKVADQARALSERFLL